MTWQKKSDLIKSDPVTCARNFEHMVQLFLRDIIKSQLKPIGEVDDFFYRVEFQQRGSPHIHSLIWVKDAPQYGENTNDDIAKFVDRYVECKVDRINWAIWLICRDTDTQKRAKSRVIRFADSIFHYHQCQEQ